MGYPSRFSVTKRAMHCSISSPQAVLPARASDVQFVRYGRAGVVNAGCMGVLGGKDRSKAFRLAECCADNLMRVVGLRVDLGPEAAKPLLLPVACAVALLALWLFPRNAAVDLDAVKRNVRFLVEAAGAAVSPSSSPWRNSAGGLAPKGTASRKAPGGVAYRTYASLSGTRRKAIPQLI